MFSFNEIINLFFFHDVFEGYSVLYSILSINSFSFILSNNSIYMLYSLLFIFFLRSISNSLFYLGVNVMVLMFILYIYVSVAPYLDFLELLFLFILMFFLCMYFSLYFKSSNFNIHNLSKLAKQIDHSSLIYKSTLISSGYFYNNIIYIYHVNSKVPLSLIINKYNSYYSRTDNFELISTVPVPVSSLRTLYINECFYVSSHLYCIHRSVYTNKITYLAVGTAIFTAFFVLAVYIANTSDYAFSIDSSNSNNPIDYSNSKNPFERRFGSFINQMYSDQQMPVGERKWPKDLYPKRHAFYKRLSIIMYNSKDYNQYVLNMLYNRFVSTFQYLIDEVMMEYHRNKK